MIIAHLNSAAQAWSRHVPIAVSAHAYFSVKVVTTRGLEVGLIVKSEAVPKGEYDL